MNFKAFGRAIAIAGFALASHAHAATYTVYLDGSEVDIFGSINFDITGTFTADEFEANVGDFSFTASLNGAASFEFNNANSTFGGNPFGSEVLFEVSDMTITLSAAGGGPGLSDNVFVVADNAVNNSRPNLLLFEDALRYRTPSPPNVSVFETVNPAFVLGRVNPPAEIPIPASLALYLPILGLGGLIARRRRKMMS